MALNRIIAGFLFALLVVFSSNNLPFEVYTTYGHIAETEFREAHQEGKGLYFGKRTKKTDHVRVRFMGAAWTLEPSPSLMTPVLNAFILRPEVIRSSNIIPSCIPYLFDLRGPPSGDC